MSKLIKLNNLDSNNIEKIFNDLLDKELIIFEDVQGSKILVNWDGKSWTVKAKSLNSDPINLIDLATQKYYNVAIEFFNSIDTRVKGLLNKKW